MKLLRIVLATASLVWAMNSPEASAQSLPNQTAYDFVQPDRAGELFQKGDTNAPLLALDWFPGSMTDEWCNVSQSGKVSGARFIINWAIHGAPHRDQLDQAELVSLVTAINALPPPPKLSPPQERWLVVRGIRTNQWFKYTYDRANVPTEAEKLYEITGARLDWFIPAVPGHPIQTNAEDGAFLVASHASTAVSFSLKSIQVWDLNQEQILNSLPLDIIPLRHSGDHCRAISSDGSILIEGHSRIGHSGEHGLCAVDLKTRKVLWEVYAPHNDKFDSLRHIALGGAKGQFAFVASGSIERRDFATGKCLGVLATNLPMVQFLKTSQDGRFLLACFSTKKGYEVTFSVTVWKADEDNPAASMAEPTYANGCISPDGQLVALWVSRQRNLQIWDWQKGTKKEVPFRGASDATYIDSMQWSPDGTRLAAAVNNFAKMVIVYDTTAWKPLAFWPNHGGDFIFDKDGRIIQLVNGEVWDVPAIKSISPD